MHVRKNTAGRVPGHCVMEAQVKSKRLLSRVILLRLFLGVDEILGSD